MDDTRNAFDDLPGDLMMWILIVSELLVFGAGLIAYLSVRVTDPAGFAEAQASLHRAEAGMNTLVLVTSGWLAALATRAGTLALTRLYLGAAAALGVVFLFVKGMEYADKAAHGVTFETDPFFTFYYLLTGFHAAHVLAGIVILGLVAIQCQRRTVEAGTAFWHMVDLVWVILFPILYLLG
ncbi:cytochrome c oxidase subunit 3 [Marimonas lutisalis]|uniref:cytochrome c oxidase subunit 3 n=1 Tax=Marimonas lutisalis TaxID=2545756 RepID=UPI0010F55981|nr:cytochrome c oxidase subunit 3 [Marimonas lutisalis]